MTDYAPLSPLQQLADDYRRESETTIRVLRAFPAAQAGFRPHETSNSAHQLAWTFAIENALIEGAIASGLKEGRPRSEMPSGWDETVSAYASGVARVQRLLEGLDEAALGRPVSFFVAPKTPGDIPLLPFVRMMLFDSVHHRGQLSVYLRMVGGRVPSIYGPSRDEPWT